MSYELHQKIVPLKIYDSSIMTHKDYREVATPVMAEFNFDDMYFVKWLDENTELIMNAVYGHRHFICLRKRRIVGLTVGHAGWITEKPKWESAGFEVILDEVSGRRYLLIGPKESK